MSGDLSAALLDALDDEQLARLADRLRPYLMAVDGERLLSPAEAASRLGVHVKTLTRAAREGRVPGAVRAGKGWRFRSGELELAPAAKAAVEPAAPARPRAARVMERASVAAIRRPQA